MEAGALVGFAAISAIYSVMAAVSQPHAPCPPKRDARPSGRSRPSSTDYGPGMTQIRSTCQDGNNRRSAVADIGALDLARSVRHFIRPRHRAARHDSDKVRAIFGTAVDIAVHAIRRDAQTLK